MRNEPMLIRAVRRHVERLRHTGRRRQLAAECAERRARLVTARILRRAGRTTDALRVLDGAATPPPGAAAPVSFQLCGGWPSHLPDPFGYVCALCRCEHAHAPAVWAEYDDLALDERDSNAWTAAVCPRCVARLRVEHDHAFSLAEALHAHALALVQFSDVDTARHLAVRRMREAQLDTAANCVTAGAASLLAELGCDRSTARGCLHQTVGDWDHATLETLLDDYRWPRR